MNLLGFMSVSARWVVKKIVSENQRTFAMLGALAWQVNYLNKKETFFGFRGRWHGVLPGSSPLCVRLYTFFSLLYSFFIGQFWTCSRLHQYINTTILPIRQFSKVFPIQYWTSELTYLISFQSF